MISVMNWDTEEEEEKTTYDKPGIHKFREMLQLHNVSKIWEMSIPQQTISMIDGQIKY